MTHYIYAESMVGFGHDKNTVSTENVSYDVTTTDAKESFKSTAQAAGDQTKDDCRTMGLDQVGKNCMAKTVQAAGNVQHHRHSR